MKQAPISFRARLRIFWPTWLAACLTAFAAMQWVMQFGEEPDFGWLLLSLFGLGVHTWLSVRAHDRLNDLRKLTRPRYPTA